MPATAHSSPALSVIMPCFQQVAFLEEAVRSVLDQPVDLELLVLDPGSTDGSRELLRSLQQVYGERLVLHFAPDRGQTDAINRGMALARGSVLCWLNSDDRFRPGALAKVMDRFRDNQPRWLYGRAGMIDGSGRPISSLVVAYKDWRGRRFSRCKLVTENFIPQMAVFWSRALWEQAGELDTGKDLDMDYDLWFRFANIVAPEVLPCVVADFRVHGEAKGSVRTGEQLRAAYATARHYALEYGLAGRLSLALHRLYSFRTRLLYLFLKP